ncbi:hypothetical protein CXB51_011903 [Gossypium anomalum]|uniref:VQ domain-containing protein n=1 Tax=Gossypium anomalum TaxID=47600 RepID=A0A8J5Z5V3_9ROSI|nr:hypothetical protein CXB51_011903 [Gossypium anomalum]
MSRANPKIPTAAPAAQAAAATRTRHRQLHRPNSPNQSPDLNPPTPTRRPSSKPTLLLSSKSSRCSPDPPRPPSSLLPPNPLPPSLRLQPQNPYPSDQIHPKNKQNSGFRLYERRSSLKNLKINPLNPAFGSNNSGFSPRKPEILSPSILDFPSLALSPVTPLIPDPFDRSGSGNYTNCINNNANLDKEAEEKAIKEKGFYLHPSPASTPRDSEPRLLPLFPVTSPRVSGSSTS